MGRPYAVVGVRKGTNEWFVGAKALRSELIELPPGLPYASVEVAVPADEDPWCLVDGEERLPPFDPALEAAFAEIERRGRARFEAFAARADRLDDGRWQLTIDPL